MFTGSFNACSPDDVHGAIGRNGEAWLVTAPCSRDAGLPFDANRRAAHFTAGSELREHYISLLKFMMYPGDVERSIGSRCHYRLSSIDAGRGDLNRAGRRLNRCSLSGRHPFATSDKEQG